jgi:prevent-host-death family protein
MKKVSITEAKNRLSALIDGLKAGSPVLIVDRGRPVARLEAVKSAGKSEDDGRLARLVREGTIRPGHAALPRSFFVEQLPHLKTGASVVTALLEERRDGR